MRWIKEKLVEVSYNELFYGDRRWIQSKKLYSRQVSLEYLTEKLNEIYGSGWIKTGKKLPCIKDTLIEWTLETTFKPNIKKRRWIN